MKKLFRSFGFWFGIVAILLVLGRETVFTSSAWQNLLPMTNLPLYAVLQWTNAGIISPLRVGRVYTPAEVLMAWMPYYMLFVLTYIAYGLVIDLIVKYFRKRGGGTD